MVPKICSVDECDRRHKARGYCSAHYSAWRRASTEEDRRQPSRSERFWAKVNQRGPDDCWHWTGSYDAEDNGYGTFWDGTAHAKAHRYAYVAARGSIPDGLVLDHVCHNDTSCQDVPCAHRRCVNPSHLEAVTQSVNSIRGRSGDHHRTKTHCPQGHPYSPENTYYGNGGRKRTCRTCHLAANAARYQRKKRAA